MANIQAICFDLDDTLWDLAPVIPRAEARLYRWYEQHYPAVAERFSPQDILAMRIDVVARYPELVHDLTALRMKVLRAVAHESGYSDLCAEQAFDVFQQARNDLEPFPDVVPAITRLGGEFRLFTLSNGNADLSVIGIAGHFEASFTAREIGHAKPDVRVFRRVCDEVGLAAEQILHVGDHPRNDIIAARAAGLRTAWVNRNQRNWEVEEPGPDHVVTCLEELAMQLLDR